MFFDTGKTSLRHFNQKKNKSGQRFYEKKDVELIFKIQRLLYLERYTIAGAKQKMRESKKKNSQLSLGFDRERFLEQKRDIISDLESIFELLPED